MCVNITTTTHTQKKSNKTVSSDRKSGERETLKKFSQSKLLNKKKLINKKKRHLHNINGREKTTL